MPATITYGVELWLVDLQADGWELRVVSNHAPERHSVIRLVEDDFEPLDLLAPARVSVGVLASRGAVSHYVPCRSERDAWELLGRVESGAGDV